jgi:7,8-didemethyl-8-hydroxy-5-deazariboflavin synthase CofH subunit/7,8-didemethyl-8-hydroxy-5-deazariboflavin synthase CofG subunit
VSPSELLDLPTKDLMHLAVSRRDQLFGARVTYSPKVFIPLTRACRDHCGYCTFASPPGRLDSIYMELDEVVELATKGAAMGCHEALFTLGERPELRYIRARAWLEAHGYSSTVDYLVAACRAVLEQTGLLPHANAGALFPEELAALRQVTVSQGMMLESLRSDLACHRRSPDKSPSRRLATLEAAGALSIPFTTGILVGIGEDEADRLEALLRIAEAHRRFGHVQEVIVQNFLPKPKTAMASFEPCPPEAHLRAIALARLVLPDDVHVQAPPNLTEDFSKLLAAGIDDWGGVSALTPDHVNPERPWPALERLREVTERSGFALAARLPIYPAWAERPERWLAEALRRPVLEHSDAEGLGRDHPWVSGGDIAPPELVATKSAMAPWSSSRSRVLEVLEGIQAGQRPGEEEVVALFGARGPEVQAVCELADELRAKAVGDVVTWVANRNINYTNICTFRCRFCAFSKGPRSLSLRGAPYLLSLDQIVEKVKEAEEAGATEVCLQGGIHPDFDGSYYLSVVRAIKEAAPSIHIHAFSALEIWEGARRLGEDLTSYLSRLKEAGLASLPGTAAEILDDPVREVLCPDKIRTDQWLEVHRAAHSVGLTSNVTIMFGAVESPRSWARHLLRTAALQADTGGFLEFVPLPFVHMGSPMYIKGISKRGPTFREALLMHAVGRIVYSGLIPNVQASWVKLGKRSLPQLLRAGCNDLGGTLMEENISRAAGASHGQMMTPEEFEEVVSGIGRRLEQRTTRYVRVAIQQG